MTDLSPQAIHPLIRHALKEDAASRDATSRAVIPATLRIRARILAKAHGIAAGVKVAALAFTTLDPSLRCRLHLHSGARISPGTTILTVEGRARSIFAAERVALNLLGHLSGIATLTAAYVHQVRGTRAQIFDTRKTLPGLRLLEKYAVTVGGGHNHRRNLSDAILIKTNHLNVLGHGTGDMKRVIRDAVRKAKRMKRKCFVEVEVINLREFKAALAAKPDVILLDNWQIADIRKAIRLRSSTPHAPPARLLRPPGRARPSPLLEASGGVTLANVRAIAKTGVDRVSIGRLTHSAPSLDVSLQIITGG